MASAADAQVVMELYKLRTEELMRKARNWAVLEFWPASAEEVLVLINAFGTEKNAYFRQVFSYWEQAASLVNRGAVDEGVFSDWAGEMFFLYAKLEAFIPAVREAANPSFFLNIEKIVKAKPEHQQRIQRIKETIAKRAAAGKK